MRRPDVKSLAARHLPFLAGGAAGGAVIAALPWPWTVTGGIVAAAAFTRTGRAERIRRRFAGPAQAVATQTRARVTTRRAEQSIPERWPSLMAELGYVDKHAGLPTLDTVTVTPDVIDARVVMPVKWGADAWREFAVVTSGALGGEEVDVQVEPVDQRDPGAPRRLTLTIDKRGLPDEVLWTEAPEFIVDPSRGVGIPIGVGVAGRSVVWWIEDKPHMSVGADTRVGKSSFLRLLITTASANGCRVDAISGKRATQEWHALDGLPTVTYHRGNATAELNAIRGVVDRVQARYEAFEQTGSWDGVPHEFLVVDEVAQFAAASTAKGRAVQDVMGLVSQAGEARVHVVAATHRWDIDGLGGGQAGTAREQMAGVQIGRAPAGSLRMVLGSDLDPDVDASLPEIRGRAIVGSLGQGLGAQVCQLAYLERGQADS